MRVGATTLRPIEAADYGGAGAIFGKMAYTGFKAGAADQAQACDADTGGPVFSSSSGGKIIGVMSSGNKTTTIIIRVDDNSDMALGRWIHEQVDQGVYNDQAYAESVLREMRKGSWPGQMTACAEDACILEVGVTAYTLYQIASGLAAGLTLTVAAQQAIEHTGITIDKALAAWDKAKAKVRDLGLVITSNPDKVNCSEPMVPRPANVVNAEFIAQGITAPYIPGTMVLQGQVPNDKIVYRATSDSIRTKGPWGASLDPMNKIIYPTKLAFRKALAILVSWNSLSYVTTGLIIKCTPIQEGMAASQNDPNLGILPGGGQQIFMMNESFKDATKVIWGTPISW